MSSRRLRKAVSRRPGYMNNKDDMIYRIADNIVCPLGESSLAVYEAMRAGKSSSCIHDGEGTGLEPYFASVFEDGFLCGEEGMTLFENLMVRSVRGALEQLKSRGFDGLDPAYYYAFMSEHPEFAYPFQKFISGDHYVAYFQFEGKLCVAFKKGKDGRTLLFTNEPYARSQLMIPHYVNKSKLYYASEPAYLSYVVDTTLMSREDIGKMNRVDEMDNPIIVVYNLR